MDGAMANRGLWRARRDGKGRHDRDGNSTARDSMMVTRRQWMTRNGTSAMVMLMYNGILVVNLNFRELHSAVVPLSPLVMPILRRVQKALRENGRSLFRTLAMPPTVKWILKEPYGVRDTIDNELVSVLLDPLLTTGAKDIVFDSLSYSARPLPEQQLGSAGFPRDTPVWVVYEKDDPWTPGRRVENLGRVCMRPGYDDDGAAAAGSGGVGARWRGSWDWTARVTAPTTRSLTRSTA